MLTAQLQAKVNDKLLAGIATIERVYGVKMVFPTISYALTGTTAGMAYYRHNLLKFNAKLLVENEQEFIENTVPHELAHLATELIYPEAHKRSTSTGKRNPHGHQWQSIMHTLGVEAKRCHSYDTSGTVRRKSTSVEVECGVCFKPLGVVGPKRLARLHNFHCTFCGRPHSVGKVRVKSAQHTPAPTLKTTPHIVVGSIKKPDTTGLTKKDVCRAIYKTNPSLDRARYINAFMSLADCSKACASTYYQSIINE